MPLVDCVGTVCVRIIPSWAGAQVGCWSQEGFRVRELPLLLRAAAWRRLGGHAQRCSVGGLLEPSPNLT
jgi:hypothetical protein